MAFQPFGYHFEVRSALSPEAAKAAIRSRKKGWFDPKNSARGWIVGPVICLQWAPTRSAPMLLGRISHGDLGTRISGRAGYLGSGALLMLAPFIVFFFYVMLVTGDFTLKSIVLVGVLAALFSLVFWVDHRDAEPLVRFLNDTVGKPRQLPLRQPVATDFSKVLTLNISGSVLDAPATPDSVRAALLEIEDDGFLILSSAEENYLQTAGGFGGYKIEKREGDDLHHYRAVRRGSAQADDTEIFAFEEALAVFFAYGSAARMPSFLEWKKIRP